MRPVVSAATRQCGIGPSDSSSGGGVTAASVLEAGGDELNGQARPPDIACPADGGRKGLYGVVTGAVACLLSSALAVSACFPVDLDSWITRESVGRTTVADVSRRLAAGAGLEARDGGGLMTLHRVARQSAPPDAVMALASAGVNLKARMSARYQISCRMWNTGQFFEEAGAPDIRRCVAAGADVYARGEGGWTALHVAAQFATTPAVIRALIDLGADLRARTGEGSTPLHFAAAFGGTPSILDALLDAGADLESRADGGMTPLYVAARYSQAPDVVRRLLALGADLDSRADGGFSPLHSAAAVNTTPSVLGVLLAAGADVEARTDSGLTPLHSAAAGNRAPVVITALLAAGADIEARAAQGMTPLHGAAAFGAPPAVVAALLDAGANTSARNAYGQTPWHLVRADSPHRRTRAYQRLRDPGRR